MTSIVLRASASLAAVSTCCAAFGGPACGPAMAPDRSLSYRQVGSDSGVETHRFLDVSVWGRKIAVEHGVDLYSATPLLDMRALHDCGASFALIRLTGESARVSDNHERARHLWQAAQAASLVTIPYHYLGATDFRKLAYPISDGQRMQATLDQASAEGRRQAGNFIADYRYLLAAGGGAAPAATHWPNRSVVVDLEEALPPGAPAVKTVLGRQQFGLVYSQMACAWIGAVRTAFPDASVVMYTGAFLVRDYDIFRAAYQAGNCLRDVPLWLAATPRGGGHPADDAKPATREVARQACFSMNRSADACIAHQYTHWGFVSVGSQTVHLDLDRLYVDAVPWDRPVAAKSGAAAGATIAALPH